MGDEERSKEQLIDELQALRKCLVQLEKDQAEHKLTAQEMREREEFLTAIIENIPNMIFVKDASGLRFRRFNKASEELLGHSREELLGRNDYDFFPLDEADFFTAKDREVLRSRCLLDIPEETILTKHRGARILHTKKIPILDEEGNPQYLLGISEDITERKRAEEALQAGERRYRQLLSSVTDYLFTIAIENGQPVATTHGRGCEGIND